MDSKRIYIPESAICLHTGDVIKLHRFDAEKWVVNFGWYQFDGNREICGWYLYSKDSSKIKPLFKTDLEDCYAIF